MMKLNFLFLLGHCDDEVKNAIANVFGKFAARLRKYTTIRLRCSVGHLFILYNF